jgi:hypothetical protein
MPASLGSPKRQGQHHNQSHTFLLFRIAFLFVIAAGRRVGWMTVAARTRNKNAEGKEMGGKIGAGGSSGRRTSK